MKIKVHIISALEREERMRAERLKGHDWKVIYDPTRQGDDPGLFYGRLFRSFDIRFDAEEKCPWPDGIVFENIHTRQQLTFQNKRLVDVRTKEIMSRRMNREYRQRQKWLKRKAAAKAAAAE